MKETNQSALMSLMSMLVNLVLLNTLFLVTCLPVVTIGAASTALYAVAFGLDQPQEEGLYRRYFRAFRESWKQSTAAVLILALFAGASLANMHRFLEMGGVPGYALFAFSGMLLLICASVYSYVFPLMSRFDNTLPRTLLNALLLSLENPLRTLLLLMGNGFPLIVMAVRLYTFLRLGSVWMLFYFAAAAWFHAKILGKTVERLAQRAAP